MYTPIALESDAILAGLLQPDGKIVVTGYYTDSGIQNFVVVRYMNDSTLSTGLNDLTVNDVLMYPQPASDVVYVRLKKKINSEITANIYSVSSALLGTVRAGSDFSYSTSHLPPGIYFLRITDEENKFVASRRFVVGR